MLSTMMDSGFSCSCCASYSATTAPVNCIRSKLRHTRLASVTVLPRRLVRLELSDPNRATSSPQIMGAYLVGATSRFFAASINSMEMMVSSSDLGNSPSTRMRYALLSSPYRLFISSTYSVETRGESTHDTRNVTQSLLSLLCVS